MASPSSSSYFRERALACGLTDEQVSRLANAGLDTQNKLAFACSYAPGQADDGPFVALVQK
eukprot:5242439-Amphidinium_carterae.1